MNIELIRNEIIELTPESGFNVVLHDDFAPWGENLTLVRHTTTREEAELVKQEYEQKVKDGIVYADAVYIYDKTMYKSVLKN